MLRESNKEKNMPALASIFNNHSQATTNQFATWTDIKEMVLNPRSFDKELSNKHQPCPSCGGTDRYRFDDKQGSGSYICGQCGAGSGINLLMISTGMDFGSACNAIGNFLMLDPQDRNQIAAPIRKYIPPLTTGRKDNRMNKEKAAAWIAKTRHSPINELTMRHNFAPGDLMLTNSDTAIVKIYRDGEIVNAAAIALDGRIAFAADKFTFGGYSICGNKEGKSVFLCADWIDSWITATATGCKVICCWSPFNFADVAAEYKSDKPLYLALNNDFDEMACAESAGLKCIVPDAGSIRENHSFSKKLHSVSDLLDQFDIDIGN